MSIESILRVSIFILALVGFSVLERVFPIRKAAADRAGRVLDNLALMAIGGVMLRLLGPFSMVGAAFFAQSHAFGIAHWFEIRLASAFIFTLIALDLALYAQHLLLHTWTPLWRLHRVHHSDVDLDTTTGVRFHPGETLLSVAYKSLVVMLLGMPPAAVVTFEVILSTCSLFNHSNLGLSPRFERGLRALLVTPAMHWVHHSQTIAESQRNFGFSLSLWERIFGTYLAAPAAGLAAMRLGITGLDGHARGLWQLLRQPQQDDDATGDAYTLGD